MIKSAKFPPVKWCQRANFILLTVDIQDAQDEKYNLEPEGKLTFDATSHGQKFHFELTLFEAIDVSKSQHAKRGRNVTFHIYKKEEGKWWDRLTKEKTKVHWLAVDWSRWRDEDDSGSDEVLDDGAPFDLSQLNMMNNFAGAPGDDDDDDDDDLPPLEEDKPGDNSTNPNELD